MNSQRNAGIVTVLLMVVAGCGAEASTSRLNPGAGLGTLNASVRLTARSGGPSITRVQVEVEPAGLFQALTYDTASGDYLGSIVVPTGPQTVTATAYSQTTLVGTGTTTVNVSSRGPTSIVIKILDNSTPPAAQDHGPVITAVSASNTSPGVNEVINVSVTAIDPDGDAVAYEWTQDCAGSFSSTVEPTPTWSDASAQSCVLTVKVSANGLSDVARLTINVVTVSSNATVSADFIAVPYVGQITLSGAGLYCSVARDATDASCRPAIPPSSALTATVSFDAMPTDSGGDVNLTDDCGGASTTTALDLPNGTATFSWTAPGATASCLITATATRDTLSDSETVAVAVAAP